MDDSDPAVSVCFIVKIDDQSLGAFNGCEGLGCEVVIEQREEGGHNGAVWQLPTRIKYPNIKLTRPVTKDTEKVTKWFSSVATGVLGPIRSPGRTSNTSTVAAVGATTWRSRKRASSRARTAWAAATSSRRLPRCIISSVALA